MGLKYKSKRCIMKTIGGCGKVGLIVKTDFVKILSGIWIFVSCENSMKMDIRMAR
jgi:hypothetical protein